MANQKNSRSFGDAVLVGLEKFGEGICKAGSWLLGLCKDVGKFKKILMALPVIFAAIWLAFYTGGKLPEDVGISLQENGQYAMIITREIAVMGPLAVTAVCLLLMFCSKRTLFPWVISIFSLVLPLLLLVTNLLAV